ncbi:hypothetical protein AKJ40_02120 [candidate division MSBL1 archaeon SCGC-AAA259M10]|uniref:DUF47 family protein n=2 Tax=candidate division MSBL1 TaxID=215777 RepID=A0A133U5V8_9EURY|nr:hypothetical protein AKJ62_02920 [candidate division MSBL1 archaeon SCGC-AAA259D14]KXA99971.1 hypothetical protein AKJ40_02120 [candidate division MSBL1 archaeon SCGC-AAA259M10]
MPSEKPLAWLGKRKEKRALNLSKKHLKKIVKTVELMKKTVHLFCENGEYIREKAEEVLDSERKADEIKDEILEELSKGSFAPLNREKIIRLIMTADDIADNARAAALKLTFLDPGSVNQELKESVKKLADFSYESTRLLKKSFSASLEDPSVVRKETGKVEKMEEKVDTFRAETLIPKLVKWADESHRPGTSILITEVENNIEDVVDRTEDCADVLREIAIGAK